MLLRDYFNSLNFYKNGELSSNQIGRSGAQVKKENEKFTAVPSRSPQNLKEVRGSLFGRGVEVLKLQSRIEDQLRSPSYYIMILT